MTWDDMKKNRWMTIQLIQNLLLTLAKYGFFTRYVLPAWLLPLTSALQSRGYFDTTG